MFHAGQPRRVFWWRSLWRALGQVGPTIWLLSATSFLTDVSSEMIVAVLPTYVVSHLGLSPLAFGAIDGAYHGMAAVMRLAGGAAADRWQRYKEVASFGYALSTVCRLAMLVPTSAYGFVSIIAIERLGKGMRTAPRDALIGLSTTPEAVARAFGVHRAFDTAGTALGPLVAAAVLLAAPHAYDAVFVVSFAIALSGLAVLVLFVRNPGRIATSTPWPGVRTAWRWGAFPRLLVAAGLLSLATMSDGFVYLAFQQQMDLGAPAVPLMFTATAAVYFSLALPLGMLADRIGRRSVWLVGHGALVVAYALPVLAGWSTTTLLACVALIGAYYAATDGVLAALVTAMSPLHVRGASLGLAATVTGLGRVVSAMAAGVAWTTWGAPATFAGMAVAVGAALAAASVIAGREGAA